MTAAYEVGDRVRVVLEGTVSERPGYDGGIGVGSGSKRNVVYPEQSHVKSIDVLERRKPKVGDKLTGNQVAEFDAPHGTLLRTQFDDYYLRYGRKSWVAQGGIRLTPSDFRSASTRAEYAVAYLPD